MLPLRYTKQVFRPRQFGTLSKISAQVANEKKLKLEQDNLKQHQQAEQDQLLQGRKFDSFTSEQNNFLNKVIRVDQAGELGANYIYQGQIYALAAKNPHLRPILHHMWEQEVHHHNTFNNLQTQHRVRPSLFTPMWKVGAIAMGFVTGSISKEAAMACTVAVETVIGNHYNEQLRVLMNDFSNIGIVGEDGKNGLKEVLENNAGLVSKEISQLKDTIRLFRDQELEHLDTAIEHDAESAVPYWLITDVIKVICKVAIWSAERA